MIEVKHEKIIFIIFLLAGFTNSFAQNQVNSESVTSTDLGFTVHTNKDRYALGEPIIVTLTWQNKTDKDFEMRMTTMMNAVSIYDEETKKDLSYLGFIVCGSGANKIIAAREKFEIQNNVNDFLFPNYELTKPGRYTVRSSYSSNNIEKRKNFWTGKVSAAATFEVFRLDEATLDQIRDKAITGDKLALQILAAHGDEIVIPSLAELAKSKDQTIRERVYRTLLTINTENSIRLLAEMTTANIPPQEKLGIIMSFYYTKPMPNPVVIPYMEKLLTDNYFDFATLTDREGEPPRRFKYYIIRKRAHEVLKKLNIEIPVIYEEEIKEEQVSNKSQ